MALGEGLGDLMKQAQQMQERVQKLQEEVAKTEVTGESRRWAGEDYDDGTTRCSEG